MTEGLSRMMWELAEPVHDLVYFTPEARQAADELGMRGFWMGYVALRAAPLGPVPPAVVTSAFYVFHPSRVTRALPDAWRYATVTDILAARRRGVGLAMGRLFGQDALRSAGMAEAADLAWAAAEAADTAGRVLGAANQALDRPAEPHARLWQAVTTLREHRGDGHVAVLVSRGVGPVEALVLKAAAGESDGALLREGRKWDAGAWHAAEAALRDRGWVEDGGRLTGRGVAEHRAIEDATDAAAEGPWRALGHDATMRLAELLAPWARTVVAAGVIPSGNPVGLTGTLHGDSGGGRSAT
ncbi:SCO6745 family protein [Streptomyces sp. NPDC001222]|uniref:SCO6745 family protein n=1 Tax=Streptomyces sp. NPDC001222 TaxID=3364548 RepID=UPI0036B4FF58